MLIAFVRLKMIWSYSRYFQGAFRTQGASKWLWITDSKLRIFLRTTSESLKHRLESLLWRCHAQEYLCISSQILKIIGSVYIILYKENVFVRQAFLRWVIFMHMYNKLFFRKFDFLTKIWMRFWMQLHFHLLISQDDWKGLKTEHEYNQANFSSYIFVNIIHHRAP